MLFIIYYLLFIILFIIYFIFMLCPQFAWAKYIDTWIKFIIIIIIIIIILTSQTLSYASTCEIPALSYTWTLKKVSLFGGAFPYSSLYGLSPAPRGLHTIDPVACLLVFFKGRSFSGLRDRLISVAAPKLWKELPFAQVIVLAKYVIFFGP